MGEGEILVITRAVRKEQWVREGVIVVITSAVGKRAVGEGGRNTGHN